MGLGCPEPLPSRGNTALILYIFISIKIYIVICVGAHAHTCSYADVKICVGLCICCILCSGSGFDSSAPIGVRTGHAVRFARFCSSCDRCGSRGSGLGQALDPAVRIAETARTVPVLASSVCVVPVRFASTLQVRFSLCVFAHVINVIARASKMQILGSGGVCEIPQSGCHIPRSPGSHARCPSELGGPSGKSFRLVRACARWQCLVETGCTTKVQAFPFWTGVFYLFP